MMSELYILTRRQLNAISIPILGFVALGTVFFLIVQFIGERSIDPEPPVALRIMIPIALFSFGILMGLIGMFYYYPEIRNRSGNNILKENPSVIDIIKYISNEDEVKVIDSLKKLNKGAYQFEIANLSSLSRMKVHRIIKRLVDRDILNKDGEGRNSKIFLSKWIEESPHQ